MKIEEVIKQAYINTGHKPPAEYRTYYTMEDAFVACDNDLIKSGINDAVVTAKTYVEAALIAEDAAVHPDLLSGIRGAFVTYEKVYLVISQERLSNFLEACLKI